MKSFLSVALCMLLSHHTSAQHQRNDSLISLLDSIELQDQIYRTQLESLRTQFKDDTMQMHEQLSAIGKKMAAVDSINVVKITSILDKYGWLGPSVIGDDGNSTLFIVIQHAHLATQEKYLPMMREAVAKGNAKPRSLALLEDRVALREGRKQIYGSQVYVGLGPKEKYVLPLEDPANVDRRRAKVGLPRLADYLRNFDMTWDLNQYEKDLPAIEKLQSVMPK